MRTYMALLLSLWLMSCSNFQSIDHNNQNHLSTSSENNLAAIELSFQRYQGSPYRFGGTTKAGFDCSGFIGVVFSEALNIELPRTTEQIAAGGKAVRRDQLQPGDIVIFKTSVKQLHAGIYTEGGKFVHASTSKGVVESNLTNAYWQQRYIKAKRYF